MNNLNNSSSSVAAAKCKALEDDDSNVYEQADSIYETILDSESPYSHPHSQSLAPPSYPPPLPNPNISAKILPSEEGQKASPATEGNSEAYSKTQFFPKKDLSKRCPSPVDYSLLKPNAGLPMPESEMEYASVNETVRMPNQPDNNDDDYVPMYDDTVTMEGVGHTTTRSPYEDIAFASLNKENDYQVPRSVKQDNEGEEKEPQPKYMNFVPGMKTQ